MTRNVIKITVLVFLGVPWFALGQSTGLDERGIPFPSEHYAPPEYGQDPQNWDVVQDDKGLIYVANNDGVLQYDGQRWHLIPTAAGTFVRSLAADSLVYVGAKGDFGYLRSDSLGVPRFVSLYERIPEDERDFEDVWGTHIVGENIYYQSNRRLFRWDGSSLTSWSSENGFHTSFVVDETLYVREMGRGLLRMENGSLELVSGGEIFHETPIYMMARHPSGDLLVGTQNKGLLLYNGAKFRSFAPGLTSYLQDNDFYHGCSLPGERYALATLGGGVTIIGSEGGVDRVLKKSSGLPDNVVNHLYIDDEGQLWMALNSSGVFRADLNAPLTVHDERTGLDGTIKDIHEHRGTPYVATASGLFVLRGQGDQTLGERSVFFEKWGNLPIVWDMVSVEEELLVGTQENGAYSIRGDSKEQIADWVFTYSLLKPQDKEIVYAGTRSGLKGLRRTENKNWTTFSVKGVDRGIRTISDGGDGILWASTTGGEILRIVLASTGRRAEVITRYDYQDRLPEGDKGAQLIDGHPTVVSKDGFFQVKNPGRSPKSWEFERRSLLPHDTRGTHASRIMSIEESGGSLWVASENRVFLGQVDADGAYDWEAIDPLHFPKTRRTTLSVSDDSTVWLGYKQQLFRYGWGKRQAVNPPKSSFSVMVRRLTTLGERPISYGVNGSAQADDASLTLPHGRDFQIDVASPQYRTVEPHQYRYKLVGRSNEWSDWTTDASRRYRDLWEGSYRFEVQARNDRGEISKTASLTLDIQPPWYRSIWAYLVYGLGFIALAYGYRRYYLIKEEHQRARQRVRELERERVVAERLKKANERLREANRLKEDFLATTSHELRTPLTNILGSLEVLRGMMDGEQAEFLDMIEKNGQRLKRTLNALLDLSMLRSGEEDVELTPTPLDTCVETVASDLRADAEEKGLEFRVDTSDPPVQADLDEQYLEQILRNLIENAIKYTEEGHVKVSTGTVDDRVYVEVEDTGIGIDEEFLPDLFEEFKQESRGRSRAYEGNGLGLAISARLADQMNGSIRVETEKNKGSRFRVEFPRSSEPTAAGVEE